MQSGETVRIRLESPPMEKHSYLRRLPRGNYRGYAIVHWTMAIQDRATGWLSADFHFRFREFLTHGLFLRQCACAVYCLMPDHVHLLMLGFSPSADQLRLIAYLRKHFNRELKASRPGYSLQKQPYDHVLKEHEREKGAFQSVANYSAQNPVRAGLVEEASDHPYTDGLVPGYPELSFWMEDYWDRFWRANDYLRKRYDEES